MKTMEKLTESEEVVMKCIWDCKKTPVLSDVCERANGFYGKKWKSQTVSTFLQKLVQKGYLTMRRDGKTYYYNTVVTEAEYRRKLYRHFVSFWGGNDCISLIKEMLNNGDITREELSEL